MQNSISDTASRRRLYEKHLTSDFRLQYSDFCILNSEF